MNRLVSSRELLAEFFGTLALLFFATGVAGAGIFFHAWHSFFELALITGLGVTAGIYLAAPNSQAHLNPAVTLAMAAWRGFPVAKVLPYILAQVTGAFGGGSLTYILYKGSLATHHSPEGGGALPQFLFTSAAPGLTYTEAMLVETVLTAVLTLVIFAVTDSGNKTIPQGVWGPLIIGLTVALLGSSFGSLTGFAMNPARDFGPRLFAYLAGWGNAALPGDFYFLVPIFGPLLGAGLGGFIYEKLLQPVRGVKTSPSKRSEAAGELTHGK